MLHVKKYYFKFYIFISLIINLYFWKLTLAKMKPNKLIFPVTVKAAFKWKNQQKLFKKMSNTYFWKSYIFLFVSP